MALHVPRASDFMSMLKDGTKFFHGLEEAVIRNIEACKEFAQSIRSAYGPNGRNKMIINHIQKLFVTSDAATIIKELEIQHPAAKLMVLASQMQEQEVGDGTNFVITFSGALLEYAEDLLRMGLTPMEVVRGYEMALQKALDILPSLVVKEVKDFQNLDEVVSAMKASIMSKQCGSEDFLTRLIAQACSSILPGKTTFNVDNVRVCKIPGAGVNQSQVVQGMVFKRGVEGNINRMEKAKIAVFTCPLDLQQTETKGTVLIRSAEELMNYSRGEENMLEKQLQSIAESGATVVVSGGKFGDMSLHYLNKYGLMGVRLNSKFDVRRLCKTIAATALPKIRAPTPEELGDCDLVYVDEIGDTSVVVFKQDSKESRIATIVIRGATDNYMDDIERAVDDGVNCFKTLTKDGRLVPGAGAVEMELSHQISTYSTTCSGLEQYAINKFAEALQVFPKMLAENAGVKQTEALAQLLAAHQEGNKKAGFNIETEGKSVVLDAEAAGILDAYLMKMWGLRYATQAACTILKVDEIIMSKPSGGPKPRDAGDADGD